MMDSTDLVVAAFVAIILSIVLGIAYHQNKAWKERLARQAEKRGGTIHKGDIFRLPELQIPFSGFVIVIHTVAGSKYSPPKTTAEVKLDSPRLPVIRIRRYGLWQKTLAAFGRERQLTGDEDFDHRWIVEADDLLAVHKLTTPDFKARLGERILNTLEINIHPQAATFTITTIPSNDEGYDHFIETVMLVLRKFL